MGNKTVDFTGLTVGASNGRTAALTEYLRAYGYLGGAHLDSNLAEALHGYQRFHGFDVRDDIVAELAAYMAAPRCGNPDVGGCGGGWGQRALTYRVHGEPASWKGGGSAAEVIAQAFGVWAAANPRLTFNPADGDAADIDVFFYTKEHGDGRENSFDGTGPRYAHAFCPDADARWRGDVHFDDGDTWAANIPLDKGARSLRVLALHEIGHALGLNHSPAQSSIMHPCYLQMIARPSPYALDAEDITAIRALYP